MQIEIKLGKEELVKGEVERKNGENLPKQVHEQGTAVDQKSSPSPGVLVRITYPQCTSQECHGKTPALNVPKGSLVWEW